VNRDQVVELLHHYKAELRGRYNAVARRFQDRPGLAGWARVTAEFDHLLWMIDHMLMDLDPGMLTVQEVDRWPEDKLHRWIGFVQGVLWTSGTYTIDELRQQSRIFLGAEEAKREG